MTPRKTVLVAGAQGQLGQAIVMLAPQDLQIIALNRAQLDITQAAQVDDALGHYKPQVVINAAAYTAVDKAESDVEQAFAINADGARHVAAAASRHGAWPIHISTDFVFAGQQCTPYSVDAPVAPLGAYGRSKAAGEQGVREASDGAASILRTAWVYGPVQQNFLRTMLRLLAERPQLRVVSDQLGTPTSTHSIARALFAMMAEDIGRGQILHWTDAGVASWFDFACAVRSAAVAVEGTRRWGTVAPIRTADYPTPAQRPAYSVLDPDVELAAAVPRPWWLEEVQRIVPLALAAGI